MSHTRVTSTGWTAVTLSQDEIWQAYEGAILVTAEPSPAEVDGIRLDQTSGVKVQSGATLRFRRLSQAGNAPILAREAI